MPVNGVTVSEDAEASDLSEPDVLLHFISSGIW